MARAASRRPPRAEAQMQFQASPREICVEQIGTATGPSQRTSISPS